MVLVGVGSVMNGLLAVPLNGLYCSTRVRGINPAPLQNINLSMDSTVSSTFFFKNGSTAKFGTGSVTFEDGLNITTVMIANDTLLEAMADYLSKQDADTLARFVHLFTPAVLEVQA